MTPRMIRVIIKSAATFGRGDGVAGLVDREIEHDTYGFPFLRGKTLKGLLSEAAEDVVFALEKLQGRSGWREEKDTLFGKPGPGWSERGTLHIGNAQLTEGLRAELKQALAQGSVTPDDILFSLTGIRRQTAMNPVGGPDHGTLRSMRVLLPGIQLQAKLSFDVQPSAAQLQLLSAAVLDMRRAGTGRNRGRGQILAELEDDAVTRHWFNQFSEAVKK